MSKTNRAETVNASVILTLDGARAVSVSYRSTVSREHVAANVAGHVGHAVTLGESRFGWTKGQTVWATASLS